MVGGWGVFAAPPPLFMGLRRAALMKKVNTMIYGKGKTGGGTEKANEGEWVYGERGTDF